MKTSTFLIHYIIPLKLTLYFDFLNHELLKKTKLVFSRNLPLICYCSFPVIASLIDQYQESVSFDVFCCHLMPLCYPCECRTATESLPPSSSPGVCALYCGLRRLFSYYLRILGTVGSHCKMPQSKHIDMTRVILKMHGG